MRHQLILSNSPSTPPDHHISRATLKMRSVYRSDVKPPNWSVGGSAPTLRAAIPLCSS